MKPNDETILAGQQQNDQPQMPQDMQPEDNKKSSLWKTVSIGGATGILFGGAAAVAADAYASKPDEEAVAVHHSSDGDSFAQAFAEARAELGAGGVFEWHGRLYNTYLKEEWDAMSDEQRHEFAQHVENGNVHVAGGKHIATSHGNNMHHGSGDNMHHISDEPEVHFLGIGKAELGDGQEHYVAGVSVNGRDVALIDVDNDPEHVFDIAIVDNGNKFLDPGDTVHDISDAGITAESFAEAVREEAGMQPEDTLASYEEHSLDNGLDDIGSDTSFDNMAEV